MVQNILTIPDERLRQKSQEVTNFSKDLEKIITDLVDTIENQHDPIGLGLSAPQIVIFKRIFVARIRNKIKTFINPRILKFSQKEVPLLEGCFSVPEIYGHVIRPAEIDIEAQSRHGKIFKNHYKGIPARTIQHEIDHLNGILFIDHVHAQNGKIFKVEKDKKGKEQLVEVAYV